MTGTNLDPEGYCPANDHPDWNQSFYFNFYDPERRTGAFIRVGILENREEAIRVAAAMRLPLHEVITTTREITKEEMEGE